MTRPLVIATRASPLALVQARHVARQLRRMWPRLPVRLLPLTAAADVDLSTPLYGMGGVGVFSTVVHQAVITGRADLGVHSCKDLPTTPPTGIAPPVIMRREDPRDCLIGAPSLQALAQAQPTARVGSSSLRRRYQLRSFAPGWQMVDLRGNVQTRLRKLRDGEAAATILAAAGLRRLNLRAAAGAVALHPVDELVPAPAQGALAVDGRVDDRRTSRLIAVLAHRESQLAVQAERAVLAGLRGGCSLPLGCYCWRAAGRWHLVARLDDGTSAPRRAKVEGAYAGLADRALAQLQG